MDYPKQVLEIHNEFQTASEKLLASAMEVINQSGANLADKVARLEKAGFKNSVEVKRFEQVKVTHEQAGLIQYYQQRYPDNKFITEQQVEAICKKYKLECAPVDRYKGFVPDAKLKQIEGFKLRCGDEKDKVLFIKRLEYKSQRGQLSRIEKLFPNGIPFRILAGSHIRTSSLPGRWKDTTIFVSDYEVSNNEILICAPKKDFDLTGLKKIGALFMSMTTVHVPDPVVLQPVKGGFLILAAWGDEASDELVVNPKHN